MNIRRAPMTDFVNLCSTAMQPFRDDSLMWRLYPDDEVYFHRKGTVFAGAMTNWLAHDQQRCTDDAALLRVWFPPVEPGAPAPAQIPIACHRRPSCSPAFELIGPVMAVHKPAEPHWCLNCSPRSRTGKRQGWGRHLTGSRV